MIQYASMAILWAEGQNADANIHSASDAIWWSYVTITTVGYGDRFPVTNLGRLVGFALLSTGVGLFAVITGFLANSFVARRRPPETPAVPPDVDERLRRLEALGDAIRALTARERLSQLAETSRQTNQLASEFPRTLGNCQLGVPVTSVRAWEYSIRWTTLRLRAHRMMSRPFDEPQPQSRCAIDLVQPLPCYRSSRLKRTYEPVTCAWAVLCRIPALTTIPEPRGRAIGGNSDD